MARIEGAELLELPRDEVWRLLNDPDTLAASIPGCRGFERDGDAEHRYRTAITVAVGAVKGVYEGTVAYLEVEEPERCTIVVSGRGDKGTIDGEGAISLEPRGEHTEVVYRGDFKLTGPIAGVGQRLAPGISRKMIVETLRGLERRGGEPTAPEQGGDEGGDEPASASHDREPGTGHRTQPPAATGPPAFRPLSIPPWGAFAAGLALGVLIGRLL